MPQYEAKLDTYQKRLLEMGDLRRQIKLLEDKNTDYMQQNVELEEVGFWRQRGCGIPCRGGGEYRLIPARSSVRASSVWQQGDYGVIFVFIHISCLSLLKCAS